MVLREKDDADYYYNVYKDNPTQENLEQLIKYRPQDHHDEINKRVILESIREEKKQKEKTYKTTLLESIRRMKLRYKFHPIANIFPLMNEEELDSLEISLNTNGYLIQFPILLFEDKILDGRNRYYISNKLNIEPVFEIFKGSKEDALEFVWSSNFPRRHLSSVQKTLAIQEYQKLQTELARKRQDQSKDLERNNQGQFISEKPLEDSESSSGDSKNNDRNPQTRDIIAKKIGSSPHTVDTINKAVKLEEEHPEIKNLLDKARKGDKSITVKRIKKEIGKIETEQKREKKLTESRKNKPEYQKVEYIPELYHQDALEFLDSIEANSIDLLFTDPPYMKDIEMEISLFASQWCPRALGRVKDTGRIFIFTGPYPEEIKAYLDILLSQDRFYLSNILIWTYRNTIGPSPEYNFKNNYQAIFYLRGKESLPLNTEKLVEKFSVLDFNAPDGRQANNFFKWQKPDDLAELIIRLSSQEDDLVVDPFAGSGTFILKATEMKRYAKGSEINANVLKIAEKRGCIVKNGL